MRVRRCTTGTRRTPQFSTTVEIHGFADVTPNGLYVRHHLPQYFLNGMAHIPYGAPPKKSQDGQAADPIRAGGPWRQRQTDKRPTATPVNNAFRELSRAVVRTKGDVQAQASYMGAARKTLAA